MKKIITILLISISISNLSTLAIDNKLDSKKGVALTEKTPIENLSDQELLELYKKNKGTLSLKNVNLYDYFYKREDYSVPIFQPLSQEEVYQLDKESKKIYKKFVRSNKYQKIALQSKLNNDLNKEIKYLSKAIKINPLNLSATGQISEAYLANGQYNLALMNALSVINTSRPEYKYHYSIAGIACALMKNYQDSIKYIDEYLKLPNYNSYYKSRALQCQALNYYELKNYAKSLNYANLSLNEKEVFEKASTILLKYTIYTEQKNKKLAKQEAWKLVQITPNAENYLRIAFCTDNQNEKLGYLKKVKSFYKEPKDIFNINYEIAKIEQNKINNAHKAIGVYSPKPEWSKISNENVGTITYWNNRQDEFFEATNACIANYKGANLAKCFESVINDEKEKTAQLKKSIYEAQMLYVQQQQVSAMQYNNYLQQQRNYQLSRPRYTNTTITPIGNTYYMNSYSY